jgi:ABC-type transporter Mla subunit MlaD
MPDNQPDLASMIADLEGYIERKATELAAERINAADDAASDRVAGVVADLNRRLDESQQARQRAEDLAAELRRRMLVLERLADEHRQAAGRLADALGRGRINADLLTEVAIAVDQLAPKDGPRG